MLVRDYFHFPELPEGISRTALIRRLNKCPQEEGTQQLKKAKFAGYNGAVQVAYPFLRNSSERKKLV